MKKVLLLALLFVVLTGAKAQTGSRMLITYFSWSGSTKALAEEIQRQTHADIYRIEPLVPYTDDYQTLAYEISNREKEENARPALKDTLSTLNDYDIIFVGCPVWWFDAPMIIHSFLECGAYHFEGKTIIPFCTFYTDTYDTLDDIINATPQSTHLEGLGLRGAQSYNASTIERWLNRIGIGDIVAGIDRVESAPSTQEQAYHLNGVAASETSKGAREVIVVNGKKVVR